MKRLNNRGVTLVEIIVSLGLISIVLIFLLNLFLNVRGTYNTSKVDAEYEILASTFIKAIGDDIANYGLYNVEYDPQASKGETVIFTFDATRPSAPSDHIVKCLRVEEEGGGGYRMSYTYSPDIDNLTSKERATHVVRSVPKDASFDTYSFIKLDYRYSWNAVEIKVPISNEHGTDYTINIYGILSKE